MSYWDPPVQRCSTSFCCTIANVFARPDDADLIVSAPCGLYCPPDSPCRLRSAVHPQSVRHLGLPRCPETQLVPPVGHPHCPAPTVEPHVSDEGHQPEVTFASTNRSCTEPGGKTRRQNVNVVFLSLFRFLSQCTEYFDLRCQLLDDLTSESTAFFFFAYLF